VAPASGASGHSQAYAGIAMKTDPKCIACMRIVITGERHWRCDELAEQIVNRLLARYGPDSVVVRGGAPGVNPTFAEACQELGVVAESLPANWLISRLRRSPVEPENRAEIEITWEHPEIASETNETALSLAHESSHVGPPAPAMIAETNDAGSLPVNEMSHDVALASTSTPLEAAKESPTDALMRMACVDRVILGSMGGRTPWSPRTAGPSVAS
jgi:hypothetical protein